MILADTSAWIKYDVPSVRAAARAAAAHIAQALNGEGIDYQLYAGRWSQ